MILCFLSTVHHQKALCGYLHVVLYKIWVNSCLLEVENAFSSPLRNVKGPRGLGVWSPCAEWASCCRSSDSRRAGVHGWEMGLSLAYRDGQCYSHFRSEGNCGTGNGQSLGLMDSVPGSTTTLCDPGQVLSPSLGLSFLICEMGRILFTPPICWSIYQIRFEMLGASKERSKVVVV